MSFQLPPIDHSVSRYQALYCLLKQNILSNISKQQQQHIISFWDITYQYIHFVKNRYNEINVIRFQKMIIELWLKYESSPTIPNTDFINFCIDYILCIGECSANLKIEILNENLKFGLYRLNC